MPENNDILEKRLAKCEHERDYYKKQYEEKLRDIAEINRTFTRVKAELDVMKNSSSWKITAPCRLVSDFLKFIVKSIKKIFKNKLMIKSFVCCPSKVYKKQKETVFEKQAIFSVIVPLYNTPKKYLKEMIRSVTEQSYSGWELCLADGSDAEHAYVEECCLAFANADSRIKYKKLEKNLGIADNTNAAIEMSTGDYIALLDHDDKLHLSALFEMAKAVNETGAEFIYTDEAKFLKNEKSDAYDFFFKPDFSPDMLRSCNYICHFSAFSRRLYEEVGGFRGSFDGSQDYDIILRLTEKARKIVHIPKMLYLWRCHAASVASNLEAKPYALVSARAALSEHLSRVGLRGEVVDSSFQSTYRIKYEIEGEPLVSIMIPNKDHVEELDICLRSVYERSLYKNFEVIIIENNSTQESTFEFYKAAEARYPDLKVVRWEHEFNYSKINNFGFEHARGEYVILLNNDIEIITPEWIEEMLMFVQRPDVGAAGMMLYYPDDTVQHAGVLLGIGGIAGHAHKDYKRNEPGYFCRLAFAQNYSAVTAAAMMVKASVYREVGGLEESFAVAFNDVDFCVKIGQAGYRIAWTPYAEAYHHESKSRGADDTPEKIERFGSEVKNFMHRWGDIIEAGDPYYNPNLTADSGDFSIKERN